MITRLFIWWHRRRAQYHNAFTLAGGSQDHSGAFYNATWHESWRDWHLAQIKRLESK